MPLPFPLPLPWFLNGSMNGGKKGIVNPEASAGAASAVGVAFVSGLGAGLVCGPSSSSGDPAASSTPRGGGKTKGKGRELVEEVVLTVTVEKSDGTPTGATEKPVGIKIIRGFVTVDELDGVMTGPTENPVGIEITLVFVKVDKLDGVLKGLMENPVGVKINLVFVMVETGMLEVPVIVHTVRVSVTVPRGVEDSLGVSGTTEDEVVGGACSEVVDAALGSTGGDEELGGGAKTKLLVGTTTGMEVSTGIFLVGVSLEAKSTLELVSPEVIVPLR